MRGRSAARPEGGDNATADVARWARTEQAAQHTIARPHQSKQANKTSLPYHFFLYHTTSQTNQKSGNYHKNTGIKQPHCVRIVTPPHSQQNGCLKLDFGSGPCRPVHSSEKGLPLGITFFENSGPAARFTGKSKIFLRKMPRAARRKIAISAREDAFFNRKLMPDG